MKPKKSFGRMFKYALLAHGFVKFNEWAFVIRINPETRGYVGMASSGDYSSRPRLRPFVGVINEQVLELKLRSTEGTQSPLRRGQEAPVIHIRLVDLLTAEELKRPFIEECGPLTEWVLEAGNEVEVSRDIVDGILNHGLPLMHRLDSVEKIYQLMSDCIRGNGPKYVYSAGVSMPMLLFLTGRVSEAEAWLEKEQDHLVKNQPVDAYNRSIIFATLLKLFRTKDA